MDARRRRLVYRSSHRGMKETDILLGRFVAERVDTLSSRQVETLETLMDESDRDLADWLTARAPVPPEKDNDVLRMIIDFANTTKRL